jgi:F-type H+-transporting ATPase subunit delta
MSTVNRAQSYTTAFLESAFERWLTALDDSASALSVNPALAARLQDPAAAFAERQRQMDALLPADLDAPVRNLLYTMMERGDLALLPAVADALRQRVRQTEAGPIPVEVTSAIALTDVERKKLEATLEVQYGTALAYEYRVDPAILGGMVVRVGDKLIDGSVASRLAAMKQSLGVITVE